MFALDKLALLRFFPFPHSLRPIGFRTYIAQKLSRIVGSYPAWLSSQSVR